MKILVLGITGMLGHTCFHRLSEEKEFVVYGTLRGRDTRKNTVSGVDVSDMLMVRDVLNKFDPQVVINCVGIIKQLKDTRSSSFIRINSLFPHLLVEECEQRSTRLIQISTDCVFSGNRGSYTEDDVADPVDVYGKSKFLGEIESESSLTIRTSIIGHELETKYGLVEWFLSQKGRVHGFTNAIYTGFPTIELVEIIKDYIIPQEDLSGIYHVSSDPISKFDLLSIISERYGHDVEVEPYDTPRCDRSLVSERFRVETDFAPKEWNTMIDEMYEDYRCRYESV